MVIKMHHRKCLEMSNKICKRKWKEESGKPNSGTQMKEYISELL